jgi:hypothetical protein
MRVLLKKVSPPSPALKNRALRAPIQPGQVVGPVVACLVFIA